MHPIIRAIMSPSSSRRCESTPSRSSGYIRSSFVFYSILKFRQALENVAGRAPVECLALFRHLMVDVVISSCFGYRLGAISRWAMDIEDPLSTAIKDFPKRGIIVCVAI